MNLGFSSIAVVALVVGWLGVASIASADDGLPPKIVKNQTSEDTVNEDGSATTRFHWEIQTTTEDAARQMSRVPFYFNERLGTPKITEAFTRKPDGRVLQVDLTKIVPEDIPGEPRSELTAGRKQLMIVFPEVMAGDSIVMTVDSARTPKFPNEYFGSAVVSPGTSYEKLQYVVSVPKSKRLLFAADRFDHTVEVAGDRTIHIFSYRGPQPLPPAQPSSAGLASWNAYPSVFVSTFADFASVSAAYQALSVNAMHLTPRVQQLADQLTASAGDDRRQQARLIYDFVAHAIQYFPSPLGFSGYAPRTADQALTAGYADDKDMVMLFQTLLAGKGITGVAVFADVDASYRAPPIPTVETFNRILVYLPEFDLYADPTLGIASFGTLAPVEFGKPALLMDGKALKPILLPKNEQTATDSVLNTVATLAENGSITGQSTVTARGFLATALRLTTNLVDTKGRAFMEPDLMKSWGTPGTLKLAYEPPRLSLTPSYTVSGTFTIDPRPYLLAGTPMLLPKGIAILAAPGEMLLGASGRLRTGPEACYSGHQVEDLSLVLPPGYGVKTLPARKIIETENLRFVSEWKLEASTVHVHREFTAKLPEAVCRDRVRTETADALDQIEREDRREISLVPVPAHP